jgi:hypothetical protein
MFRIGDYVKIHAQGSNYDNLAGKVVGKTSDCDAYQIELEKGPYLWVHTEYLVLDSEHLDVEYEAGPTADYWKMQCAQLAERLYLMEKEKGLVPSINESIKEARHVIEEIRKSI